MIIGPAYRMNMPISDVWECERQNRYYNYLEGLIKVETSLNPYPTDEGYQKLLLEIAKSCCRQEQRIALIKLLGFDKKEEDDE
jgi:hypothetical protein